jgi:hypothetical protein
MEARARRLVELTMRKEDFTPIDQKILRRLALSLRNETAAVEDARTKAEADREAAASSLFDPILGNYNVTYTLPPEDKSDDRPVGGKWSRNPLFSIQRSYQHLVQPTQVQGAAPSDNSAVKEKSATSVAQVVNVIVVRFLLWTVHVILRGDAYALSADERSLIVLGRRTLAASLSDRTVRADFDPPRIIVSTRVIAPFRRRHSPQVAEKALVSVSLGPQSSVVLDTPYCDSRIRIGKGSKGSLFVFSRLNPDDDKSSTAFAESDAWRELLQIRPVGKLPLLVVLGSMSLSALSASLTLFASGARAWNRLWSIPLGLASMLATLGIAFSSGGIESDRTSAQEKI